MDTCYGKIETLYERDDNFKVISGKLKNRVYGLLKCWEWTEKIDGTNIRLIWDGTDVLIGGRTDNAQIPADLVNYLRSAVTIDQMRAIFPDCPAVIYGEGFGAGIQKGGGYAQEKRFIVYDCLVAERWWLNWENTVDVATKLGLPTVPYLGSMTLEEAAEKVRIGFISLVPGARCKAEGLVGRPAEALFDKKGHRLITKLKTKDF